MNIKGLSILLFACLLFNINIAFAQKSAVTITGKVVESNSQQPIEFATIMLADKATKSAITGTTTDIDGKFMLKSTTDNFYLEITFIGFTKKTINEFSVVNGRVDLGKIVLLEDSETLDEVVVRAEKSSTEFQLDKRVFNVGKDLSSTGASALEVLNNVPSVNVNIEGEISLRGTGGVQILINGKPSVLSEQGNALGTLTADMIEKIEVITNPSAKYDAEGTSGIINIVLKKEERKGINGSVSINAGFPSNQSIGVSLNRRTEKFNLFSQLGVGYKSLPSFNENINKDLINDTKLSSEGIEYRNENFYNVILGTDYHINKNNVLTLSGNFAYEIEEQPSETNFSFYESDVLTSSWNRKEVTEATNPKWQYELQYKKDFEDDKNHDMLFSVLGTFFGKKLSSEFENTGTLGGQLDGLQQTATDFKEAETTFKFDYTKPFNEKLTLETGAQYVINNVSNDFEVTNLVNDEWIQDPNLTNVFEFDQKVLGVYATGAYEDKKWGVKLGLRLENTDLKTLLLNTNEPNSQNYTKLFPSLHTSYKLTKRFSVQAGYSKRVYRPGLWELNPFFNIRNNFSIRKGNPNLNPSFTDSYEVSSIYILEKSTLNFSVYHRYTTDVIERISTFEDNVTVFQPQNIGTSRTTGLELNGKYAPKKWFTLTGDANYNYFNRQGTYESTVFDFNASQWSGKITTKFKLPADIDFEITGRYRSKEQTVQGVRSANMFADMGLRKKIIKGKGVINVSVRDIFASRIREFETNQEDFYVYSFGQRGRFITVGFSYGFGKGEAMEYSGQRRRH